MDRQVAYLYLISTIPLKNIYIIIFSKNCGMTYMKFWAFNMSVIRSKEGETAWFTTG